MRFDDNQPMMMDDAEVKSVVGSVVISRGAGFLRSVRTAASTRPLEIWGRNV